MKFSLILATVGRVEELEIFLSSLERQSHRCFEVLLVDQNSDARLAPLAARYAQRFPLTHLGSQRGLSRARNVALPYASGDVVAFPDDDCWYPPDLLEGICDLLESRPGLDGVAGRCLTETGKPRGRWAHRPGPIGKYNIFGRCISFAIFLRRPLVRRIGQFDESLGLGASTPWLGAEDYDYLLRAALAGAVFYDPRLTVYHGDLTSTFSPGDRDKRYGNALGFGRFLAKHRYLAPFVVYYSVRYLADAGISLAFGNGAKARYRWATLVGNFEGWLGRIPTGSS
jgi:glycosyltransferase involved in cell wall biosynthesis